eukprot:gb/GECH01009114.1/.p1 GENE.gb/GECH01009114.1/~~gb/GECH01009114.1/.p1  ORF type:complete len:368 (+),score=46.15 gb/GECH01009114.1/:1-1104(+)
METIRVQLKQIDFKSVSKTGLVLLFSQILSLLLTSTGIFTTFLRQNKVSIPTAQSTGHYFLLSIVYIPILLFIRWRHGVTKHVVRVPIWKYILLAIADVEANYLVVKAYDYTTITSVMLLDCFTIPIVMGLSKLLFKVKYRWNHLIGVPVCVAGLVLLVFSDFHSSSKGVKQLIGDFLCIAGTALYACSNVGQEFIVRYNGGGVEYLALLGFFGFFINFTQLMILERSELSQIKWSVEIGLFLAGFALSLFLLYTLTPHLLKLSSATFMNLAFLTSDLFAVIADIFIFHQIPNWMYYLAFTTTITGLIIYNVKQEKYHENVETQEQEEETLRIPDEDEEQEVLSNTESYSTSPHERYNDKIINTHNH